MAVENDVLVTSGGGDGDGCGSGNRWVGRAGVKNDSRGSLAAAVVLGGKY